jgi:hypothetical protein
MHSDTAEGKSSYEGTCTWVYRIQVSLGAFEHGVQPYQAADLIIKLRNQLIHYKSEWGARNDPKSAVAGLFEEDEEQGRTCEECFRDR